MKEIMDMEKRGGHEGFQDTDPRKIQELINMTPEELTDGD